MNMYVFQIHDFSWIMAGWGVHFSLGFMGARDLCSFARCLVGSCLKRIVQCTFNVQPSAMQFFESDVFFSQCFSLREMLDSFLDAVSNQNHNSTSAISRESESRAVVVVYICCLLYFLFLNEFNVFEGLHLNRTFAHQVSDCYTQSRDFDPYVAQASRDGCAFMRFLYFFNELQTRRAKFKFKSVLVTVLVREAAFYLSKLAQLPWPRAWSRVHILKFNMNVWYLKRLKHRTKKIQKKYRKMQHMRCGQNKRRLL